MGDMEQIGQIERVSVKDLTPMRFIKDYANANRPVVLLDVVSSWQCWETWRSDDGHPKLSKLAEDFAGCQGPVVNCESSEEVGSWDVGAFFACLEQGEGCEHLYLKDWHFVQALESKDKEVPYKVPDFLAPGLHDWLNLFKLEKYPDKADYRFCYVGPKGTRTDLHHDVLLSHSWSANICGKKHWIFYPPDAKEQLEIRPGAMPSSAVPGKYDAEKFPDAKLAYERRMEVVQEPGELIFVPSGWYHEVENLTLAISINHNWLNATNASEVWKFLEAELQAAQSKIEDELDSFTDEQEFLEQCHKIMKSNCDMDVADWLDLLTEACKHVKGCYDESPKGEKLRELEWVESKLSALCQECAASPFARQTPCAVFAAAALRNCMQEPYEVLLQKRVKELARVRLKHSILLQEQRERTAQMQAEEKQLRQRYKAYQERKQRLQDQCQCGIAELAM